MNDVLRQIQPRGACAGAACRGHLPPWDVHIVPQRGGTSVIPSHDPYAILYHPHEGGNGAAETCGKEQKRVEERGKS
eukprot:1195504-Prorocentrum_minimum.AAC.2